MTLYQLLLTIPYVAIQTEDDCQIQFLCVCMCMCMYRMCVSVPVGVCMCAHAHGGHWLILHIFLN